MGHSRRRSGSPRCISVVCDGERRPDRGAFALTYIQLTYSDLALPALLVVMNGALSVALHLKLERQLAIASARMVVQLVLVGYVLTFLFASVSPLWTAVAAIIMVLFASRKPLRGRSEDCEAFGRTVWARDALCSLRVR